ncbi:hydrolase [Vibrio alfacsensis]|uniref:HAD family hydrolase n=1 Tax=Vibrio alfacsensis TaxID=1074311 RepID=UPI001BEED773|nr:HAD hydrolase-like protein [Vibrio alfacsensis]BBM66156.1 hydrolase [Vibrio alfacsensis]
MIYLFDWGNTLMVDFPHAQGKMCNWEHVETIPKAREMLSELSQNHSIYIATSASDSRLEDVQKAFQRVELDPFISGYFCYANLGVKKNHPAFYQAIAAQLKVKPTQLTMVGDLPQKDIYPAMEAGLNTIWFNPKHLTAPELSIPHQIHCLSELI